MGVMLLGGVILGLAVLVNFLFIINKLQNGRYLDAITDVGVMMAASSIYGMSLLGGVSATFGSMFISIYLHYKPLNFNVNKDHEDGTKMSNSETLKKMAERIDSLFED